MGPIEVEILDFNQGRESKASKRFHRKRPVYAGDDFEGAKSCLGYFGNHRDFRSIEVQTHDKEEERQVKDYGLTLRPVPRTLNRSFY